MHTAVRAILVLCAVSLALAASQCARASAQVLHDPRLAHDTLYQGPGMVALAFAPDGRLYVCQKRGRVLSFAPDGKGGFAAPSVLLDLTREVTFEIENGLLGIALDPAFASNRQLYLFYTRDDGPCLVRVTVSPSFDGVEPGSRRVLLSELPHENSWHKGGQLAFKPDEPNALYVGLGDDGDASGAQDLDRYEGKILRLHKADGRGLADNPFCDGELDAVRCRIWAHGLRNAFRFVFPASGTPVNVLYLAENGDTTDRLSRVTRGSDGGWNAAGDSGGFLSPKDENHRVLLTQNGSLAALLLIEDGAFTDAEGSRTMLVANGTAGTIQRYRLQGEALDQLAPLDLGLAFLSGLSFAGAVDMTLGPDGALYYVNSSVDASDGQPYLLGRVRVVGAEQLTDRAAQLTAAAQAPSSASGSVHAGDRRCDDLSSTPSTDVAYESHIQPIWTTQCVGCHDGGSGSGAGLDLRLGSLARLLTKKSAYLPGRQLIVPGSPERSYLFEKLNCAAPEHGLRMRPDAALTAQKRGQVRDWIIQLGQPPKRPPFRIRLRYIAAALFALAVLVLGGLRLARRRRRRLGG